MEGIRNIKQVDEEKRREITTILDKLFAKYKWSVSKVVILNYINKIKHKKVLEKQINKREKELEDIRLELEE